MADVLSQISQGLRGAAGILNPDVQKETFAADERAAQRGQAQAQFLVQMISQQVASGAMQPDKAQEVLASKGINIPIALFGQSPDAKIKLATIARSEAKDKYLSSPMAQAFIEKSDDVGLIRDMARRGLIPADEALKAIKESREGDKPISLGGGNGLIPQIDPQTGVKTWKQVRNTKPMVEHSYPVSGPKGEPMVQPHISHDEGLTWNPIPGTVPSPKFAKSVGSEEPLPMTDDTLRMDAFRYLTDGTLPPNMGRGVQGTAQATKLRNEASRIAKDEMGMSMDEIRMAQLTNKSQVAAIAQLGRARAQILQYEKLANLSADVALQESAKVDRTQYPVINKVLQTARVNLAGDPAALRFFDATETFVSEYAKVMSGGYGAAAPTEGAQNRAHNLLNTAATKEQFKEAISLLKQEMNNRKKSLDSQMDDERGRLRGGVIKTPKDGTKAPGKMSDDELLRALNG